MPEAIDQDKIQITDELNRPWVKAWNKRAAKVSTPWKKICCKACWTAKGSVCLCRCEGKHHGKGVIKEPNNLEDFLSLDGMKPASLEMAERICRAMEEAIEKHPEWAKYLERIEA